MGKCVFAVKAENGRITAAYNEDGFTSDDDSHTPNLNGFISCVKEIFIRNDQEVGIFNDSERGPDSGSETEPVLQISNNCNQN
jgi:hypothetical protein